MLIGAVAVASLVTVAGCGSATDISSSTGASLTKANFASAMTKATTQVSSFHLEMHARQQGQQLTMNADMDFNGASRAAHLSAQQVLQKAAMEMTMTIPGGKSLEMRLVDGVMYLKAAGLGIPQQSGKPWLKLDLNSPDNPLGSLFGNMSSLDPSQMTRAFRSITTLTKVGTETVDGKSTIHYRVSLDTAKAAGLMGLGQDSAASQLPKSLTYDVWVDGDARPVQISMKIKQMSMDMHFSKWNVPVHVVAPPASEVAPFGH
jgi:hypothetical protein